MYLYTYRACKFSSRESCETLCTYSTYSCSVVYTYCMYIASAASVSTAVERCVTAWMPLCASSVLCLASVVSKSCYSFPTVFFKRFHTWTLQVKTRTGGRRSAGAGSMLSQQSVIDSIDEVDQLVINNRFQPLEIVTLTNCYDFYSY
jgi:hypothetical protein